MPQPKLIQTSEDIREPLSLVLDYPPGINSYWTMARGHIIVSSAGKAYRRLVAYTIHCDLYTGPLAVSINLYRPRKTGDIDGPLKCLLDAMQDVVYINDSQITQLHVWRHDDKKNPRAEVTITPVSER